MEERSVPQRHVGHVEWLQLGHGPPDGILRRIRQGHGGYTAGTGCDQSANAGTGEKLAARPAGAPADDPSSRPVREVPPRAGLS